MIEYYDTYLKRLNRFGTDYQSRVEGARQYSFLRYVNKSIYKVTFTDSNGVEVTGTFEPYKQDETETLHNLLVPVQYSWPGGTVFEIRGKKWMIVYQKEAIAKGYNKFIMLKMSHEIKWKNRKGEEQTSPAYYYGPMTEKIYDMLKTYLKGVIYKESNKYTHLVMPRTEEIMRADYLEIEDEAFSVFGYDKVSTQGVMYITLNERHLADGTESPKPPEPTEEEPEPDTSDFFWFNGK